MKRQKQMIGIGLSGLLLLSTVGCLKTPDVEYVTNKENQGTLIEDNAIADNGILIAEQANLPERAEGICENVNEYTTIEVDAAVVVPEVTGIPINTLTFQDVTEERIEEWASVLFDEKVHNILEPGSVTVEECYEHIEHNQNLKTQIEEGAVAVTPTGTEFVWDENMENLISVPQDYAESLDEAILLWQSELETAVAMEPEEGVVDYSLISKEEKIYIDDLTTIPFTYGACCLSGMQQGKNYDFFVFCTDSYAEIQYTVQQQEVLECGYSMEELRMIEMYRNGIQEFNDCKYSCEEAVELCQQFLQELGIENLDVQYAVDLDLSVQDGPDRGKQLGRRGYRIYFYRTYGEMGDVHTKTAYSYVSFHPSMFGWNRIQELYGFQIQNSGVSEEEVLERGLDRIIAPEVACFYVTDDGIVSAYIVNPMEEKEQLAENVLLLDFEQVLAQGMVQLETLYGDMGSSQGKSRIRIQTIELNYARMQSPDNPEEFAMIPVWDFKSGPSGDVKVSINAIDGTVFNREQGH